MDRWTRRGGKSQRREEKKKEDPSARCAKGRKGVGHCILPMICGSRGLKSRLAKAAGAEPSGQMRDEKLHAVVARSRFPSQNVPSTPCSEHFWKFCCRKNVRAVLARSTYPNDNLQSTPLEHLEVEMSQECTPLWREADYQVKMYKAHLQCWTTFGSRTVKKVDTVVAQSTCPSHNQKQAPCSEHFWKLSCRKK